MDGVLGLYQAKNARAAISEVEAVSLPMRAMPASPDPKEASRALRSLSSRPNESLAQRPEHAHARRIGEQIGAFRRHHSETASAHAAIQADGFHPLHISVAR